VEEKTAKQTAEQTTEQMLRLLCRLLLHYCSIYYLCPYIAKTDGYNIHPNITHDGEEQVDASGAGGKGGGGAEGRGGDDGVTGLVEVYHAWELRNEVWFPLCDDGNSVASSGPFGKR
jgi:hypothetical protein